MLNFRSCVHKANGSALELGTLPRPPSLPLLLPSYSHRSPAANTMSSPMSTPPSQPGSHSGPAPSEPRSPINVDLPPVPDLLAFFYISTEIANINISTMDQAEYQARYRVSDKLWFSVPLHCFPTSKEHIKLFYEVHEHMVYSTRDIEGPWE